MKNIRIDYYRYRLRKGRADILLQRTDGENEYCIPNRYVETEEKIASLFRGTRVEDDTNGDLVIIDYGLQTDRHLKTDGKEWIPLNNILGINFPRNEFYHVSHNILRLFLSLCPGEGELGLRRKVAEMLETVKVNIAKKEYITELQEALERDNWVIPDARMTPPDPELIKKEIETLEHFRLHKPHEIAMNLRDGILSNEYKYSYEPIDWEEFGAKVEPVSFTSFFNDVFKEGDDF